MRIGRDIVDISTGEIMQENIVLNEVIEVRTVRPNGRVRIQQDFSNCPSLAEQHSAHLTDVNYLMKRFKPDELAQYIAARSEHRRLIEGHDFSQEPDLVGAKNVILKSKKAFEDLPSSIRDQFRSHVEFLKFIDNPANEEKMLRLGLLKPKQVEDIKIKDVPAPQTPTT